MNENIMKSIENKKTNKLMTKIANINYKNKYFLLDISY
jgi:hypothetical protein